MGDVFMHVRTGPWRALLATSLAAALGALLAAGCGGGGNGSPATDARKTTPAHTTTFSPAREAKLLATGQRVFAKDCHSCHTLLDRPRTHPTFEIHPPDFNEVRPEFAYVKHRATHGGIDMQSFDSELSAFQIEAVALYVSKNAGRDVHGAAADQSPLLAEGKQLFAQHCALCHGIAGRGRTGSPQWGGTNFNVVKPGQAWVRRTLHTGVEGAMPVFDKRLSSAQLQAVAAYVESVGGENPEVQRYP
jgi:mono/diheme cytochrome c family protein